MSLLSRFFGEKTDRKAVRPLWDAVVRTAREPRWYRELGLADTLEGQFEAVTMVLAAVLLRMEEAPELMEASVRLTETFVDDMDGQLRNGGVGDLSVGKNIGKQMGVLGGRLGVLRQAKADGAEALGVLVARNLTFRDGFDAHGFVPELEGLIARLSSTSAPDLLAGRIAP